MPSNRPQRRDRTPAGRRGACLGLLLLALTACAQPAPLREAPQPPPGSFSAGGEAQLPERWWHPFGDPVLDRLVDQALTGSFSLQSAWDRLDRARAAARKAGADTSLQLNGEAGAALSRFQSGDRRDTTRELSLGLAASYEIDLWGRIGSAVEAAELDAKVGAEELRTAALTLSARVATTWFQLREQRGQVALLTRQLETNRQTLELIDLQFRTGQAGIADLLQQRQTVENRKGEMALAAGRARQLENQLALLLGLPPDGFPAYARAAGDEPPLPPLPETGLRSALVERRPDVRAAWLRVLAADRRVAAAVADRFPRLSLTGRAGTDAERLDALFDDWLATLAANLVAPLIDGGRRAAEEERSRAVAGEALHDYGQAVLAALVEVEDALALESRQLEYLASVERQLELAGQATASIRGRYLNGAVDYQRVLLSVLSEQQLERTRLTARRQLFEHRVALCRALAGGWEAQRPNPQLPGGD